MKFHIVQTRLVAQKMEAGIDSEIYRPNQLARFLCCLFGLTKLPLDKYLLPFRSLRVHLHSDLAYVERSKLEKKRERNRLAASKCRQRKMEKIQILGKLEYFALLGHLSKYYLDFFYAGEY